MQYIYEFKKGANWREDFSETYSIIYKNRERFIEEDDCIKNFFNEKINLHEYISIAHKKAFSVGASVSLVCSFEKYGAPLVTLANSIEHDKDGYPLYGDHYEIVAYEGGCNVWFITKAPEGSGKSFIGKGLLRLRFPITDGEKIDFKVSTGVREGFITVDICGNSFDLPAPELSERFHIGLTACEGINRLYSAVIEE